MTKCKFQQVRDLFNIQLKMYGATKRLVDGTETKGKRDKRGMDGTDLKYVDKELK